MVILLDFAKSKFKCYKQILGFGFFFRGGGVLKLFLPFLHFSACPTVVVSAAYYFCFSSSSYFDREV